MISKRAKSIKFKPTHKLGYDRGIWIPVIVCRELGYAITASGTVFYIDEATTLKPIK